MRVTITGANSGVGEATTTALAAAGHQVVIACRTVTKGNEAAAQMAGDVEVRHLDLADLSSADSPIRWIPLTFWCTTPASWVCR